MCPLSTPARLEIHPCVIRFYVFWGESIRLYEVLLLAIFSAVTPLKDNYRAVIAVAAAFGADPSHAELTLQVGGEQGLLGPWMPAAVRNKPVIRFC